MICPYCSGQTKVTNSRSHNDEQAVWRRRQCKKCSALWSTDESFTLETSHRVKRPQHKHLEPFSRDELFISIRESLIHRKHPTADATALTATIITKLLAQKDPIINTRTIKTVSKEVLNRFDKTAAAVYASRHDS